MFGFFKKRKPAHSFRYTCSECGEVHEGPPSFSFAHPPGYPKTPQEREEVTFLMDTADCCAIAWDEDIIDRFIRVVLELPIQGTPDVFMYGLWVTQSEESFDRYVRTINQDQSDDRSFAWLFVDFAPFHSKGQKMVHLACDAVWQGAGQRPKLWLHDGDHPLVRDQQNGITQEKAAQMAQALQHP